MLKGCEPLPRRRCRAGRAPRRVRRADADAAAGEPVGNPHDTSVLVWDAGRPHVQERLLPREPRESKGSGYDCKDCFDLRGREKDRWMRRRAGAGDANANGDVRRYGRP